MQFRRFRPLELIDAHNASRAAIESAAFFGSKFQKQREMYCAGHFALAYEEAKAPCHVLYEEPDPKNHVDFHLETATGRHQFQLTEIQEPDRRRGDEYRSAIRARPVDETSLQRATDDGPSWIASAIEKKRRAYAGTLSKLHLLVYVNFPAYSLSYQAVVEAVPPDDNDFASIWLITGDSVCCLKVSPDLGALPGWYKTPAVTGEA